MNRSTLFLSCIVLIFVFIDFNERFLGAADPRDNTFQTRWNNTKLKNPQLTQEQKDKLELASNYASSASDESTLTAEGITAEQQKLQQGTLTKLFIGDWLYQLTAIVYPENLKGVVPFALLKATNVKNNETKVEKVNNGGYLSQYEVNIRNTQQVEFQDAGSKRGIALVMYKLTPAAEADAVN